MKAIIVFTDAQRSLWRRWLKPGFGHCFAVLADGPYWIAVEFTRWQPSAYVLTGTDFDLAGAYRDLGHVVVEVETRERRYFGPIGFVTCVGQVKRLCGLRSWAVTPWQLYRVLAGR